MQNEIASPGRPDLKSYSIDVHHSRSSILRAIQAAAPLFHGTLLDVGCGEMPYRELLLKPPSRVTRYVGLDLLGGYHQAKPDVYWNGAIVPLANASVDSALATEVLEHCPEPSDVLSEVFRVLKPGGVLLLTVPFLWPLHDTPGDEFRYTPFSMERLLRKAGFGESRVSAFGGWDASLAQMIGLWVRRRPMPELPRRLLQRLALPLCRCLWAHDRRPIDFTSSPMITGFSALAVKPVRNASAAPSR